ncbi:hypothetical protein GIB67_012085, partial [Kingdonia uniflora]
VESCYILPISTIYSFIFCRFRQFTHQYIIDFDNNVNHTIIIVESCYICQPYCRNRQYMTI